MVFDWLEVPNRSPAAGWGLLASCPSIFHLGDDHICDAVEVSLDVALPDADDEPTVLLECLGDVGVALRIPSQLGYPIVGVALEVASGDSVV